MRSIRAALSDRQHDRHLVRRIGHWLGLDRNVARSLTIVNQILKDLLGIDISEIVTAGPRNATGTAVRCAREEQRKRRSRVE